MIRFAKQYGSYGYKRVTKLLRIEGWRVNHKKIERLWKEEGLQLPQRHKRRRRLYHKDTSIIRLRPAHPNHVWSVDFVHDRLSNGRPYKMLAVLDEVTRQGLRVAVAFKMGSTEVREALFPLLLEHGRPEYIRSGPEPFRRHRTLRHCRPKFRGHIPGRSGPSGHDGRPGRGPGGVVSRHLRKNLRLHCRGTP